MGLLVVGKWLLLINSMDGVGDEPKMTNESSVESPERSCIFLCLQKKKYTTTRNINIVFLKIHYKID